MRSIELGRVLPMEEAWTDDSTPRWVEIRELALRAVALAALEAMAPVLQPVDAD